MRPAESIPKETSRLPPGLVSMIHALETGEHTVDELAIICDTDPDTASAWLELCVCFRGAHLAPGGDLGGRKRWTMKGAEE